MMLKPPHKLARIRALMLVSQALLLCFMVYWLQSEYYGEQEKLRKELTLQLDHSQDVITDSMITTTIIAPLIKVVKDTIHRQAAVISRIEIRDSSFTDTDVVAQLKKDFADSGKPKSKITEQKLIYRQDEIPKEIFERSIRLMLKTTSMLPPEIEHRLLHTDTAVLLKAFLNELNNGDKHFRMRWINSNQQVSEQGLYLSIFGTPGYQLQVAAYRSYLLRQMIPQCLITLVLLSLTGLAFLVTYRSLRAQIQLAAIRNDFISNMSHELKTPVSTVKVALEAISEPEVLRDLPTARDYIHMARLEVARLELLINQTLQTSLLEEGNIRMQTEPVDMKALVDDLISTMQPRFSQHAAVMETEALGTDFTVPADRLQVQGVVINIFDNALKYAGPSPAIKLCIAEQPADVAITISDHGPGIPEVYAGRIFDKFFRVPRGNEHSIKGYGLGLSYAAQVMKLHGGSIAMQATPGGGCTFLLRFKKSTA